MIGNPVPMPDPEASVRYVLEGRYATIEYCSPRILANLPHRPDTALGVVQIVTMLAKNTEIRTRVPRPFRHIVISIPPGEQLGDNWRKVIEAILRAHGVDPKLHDFLAIRHHDKPHEHVHIMWCRIGSDGSLLRDHMRDGAITQQVCHRMEKLFNLRRLNSSIPEDRLPFSSTAPRKRKRPSRAEWELTARGVIPKKEMFRNRIRSVWPAAGEIRSFQDLTSRWEKEGIQVELCRKGSRVGMVYVVDGERKKASELGKEFQWGALEPHISRDITNGDISSIRSIRPRTKTVGPTATPIHDVDLAPPSSQVPKPARNTAKPLIEVDLLASMELAYAQFSAVSKEQQRLRLSCLKGTRPGPPSAQDSRHRGQRRFPQGR